MIPDHLSLTGIIGSTATFTDADIRGADHSGRDIVEQLRRGRFVAVDVQQFGQRDAIYTVRYEVPSITSMPAPTAKIPTVPPKAKAKTKTATKNRRR